MILRMSSAVTTPRSVALDPNEQRVIEEARARRLQRLAKRELWSLVAFTTAFVAAARRWRSSCRPSAVPASSRRWS